MTDASLLYIADPMCSWCYGFGPEMRRLVAAYGDRIGVELIAGGLYPGNAMVLPPGQRRWVLHHWAEVQAHTGLPFDFDAAMPEGFVYDTEPACRAVVAMRRLAPDMALAYFDRLQGAFYRQARDLTDDAVLVELAGDLAPDAAAFTACLNDPDTREATQGDFHRRHQFGVRGMPAVILSDARGYKRLTEGYQPFDTLRKRLEKRLTRV
ncbi:MAG: DsbA family protein [Salinisphaeraceae bacterium]